MGAQPSNNLLVSGDNIATLVSPDYAVVPVEQLTKSQMKKHNIKLSQQQILLGYDDQLYKNKHKFKRTTKLITVHNESEGDIYVSVYDKRRVGVGKHVRISPVFCVEKEKKKFCFEKPYTRNSRTKWLLF